MNAAESIDQPERRHRTVFYSISAQADNLGDIEIRNTVLQWILETRSPVAVFVGSMPTGYIDAFDGIDGVRLFSSPVRFQWELLRSVAGRRASIVFAPGPHILSLSARSVLKAIINTTNVFLVRASGGAVLSAGRALRSRSSIAAAMERIFIKAFQLYAVRDDLSGAAVGRPLRVSPDVAFEQEDVVDAPDASEPAERYAALSFRSDRTPDLDLIAKLLDSLSAAGLIPIVVSQVRRDDEMHTHLADRFGIRSALWGGRTHREQRAIVDSVLATSAYVVSNRLHALLFGLKHGAVPIGLDDAGLSKLTSTIGIWLDLPVLDDELAVALGNREQHADFESRLREQVLRPVKATSFMKTDFITLLEEPRSGSQRRSSGAAAPVHL